MSCILNELEPSLRLELLAAPNTWIADLLGTAPQAIQQWRERHKIKPATTVGGAPRKGKAEWLAAHRKQLYRATQADR